MRHALLLLLMLGFQSLIKGAEAKPNVIFILADDLGIGNVGCYGSDRYKTPHIDQLAAQGVRFTQCFTAALCGPSRALIMSGRYAFRNGATNQDACTNLDPKEIVLPRLFKAAGYATACIGKWGQLPGEPGDHGFDDWLRFNGSGVYFNAKDGKPERYSVNGDDKKLADGEYMPDMCHDRVVKFVRQHRDEPFFVYYPMSHVHGELMPTPDSAAGSTDLMADNIAYVDKLVGQLMAELDTLKLRDNTLVIFMGDNGTGKGMADRATIGGKVLSGMKGTMLECGGLVPMIASWPAKAPAGRVCADLIDSTDFVTTFAEVAGTTLPSGMVFDGHSIVPQLLGESAKPRTWVFNQLARMWYVREAQWKLNEKGELFDMSGAPFTETLVTHDTETSKAARQRLQAVLAELNPAGGILDQGDGSGRHANKEKKKKRRSEVKPNAQERIRQSANHIVLPGG
ncbi:MAG: sulfatase-like hydrolase/transferase [Verrucomicrobiaceae bacterium]|nr:sulfatase-like hydrolase/transferase [Verrucomicrobiaceae bacterium]